ncbi:MAG: lycopene cyclase family protein, partial [Bacteroidota bacterium]
MKHFDYIFTGGGCAGLSTALYMSRLGLGQKRILIIDKDEKKSNDRTWCYWSKGDHPFPEIVHRSWTQLQFGDDQGLLSSAMRGYQYHLVRGEDFYKMALTELSSNPNVSFLQKRVDNICPEQSMVKVWAGDQVFTADYVLNSIVTRNYQYQSKHPGTYFLHQHFMGWWIESEDADFEVDTAILMDFRTPQLGDARFFYVLPLSPQRALVEFTVFSEQLLEDRVYRSAIEDYLQKHLGIEEFEVTEEEFGVIPMTNGALGNDYGNRVISIGTAGGAVKPTTGYAFIRIQREAKQLARQLIEKQSKLDLASPQRFKFYDNLLLHILENEGYKAANIFSNLFRNN